MENDEQMGRTFVVIIMILVCSSCQIFKGTAKKSLSDGFYTEKSNAETQKIYVDVDLDTIHMYPTSYVGKKIEIDTSKANRLYLPELETTENIKFNLRQNSFDIDFLTIPLKLRFAEGDVPPQLNTNLNGAVFFGYRTDIYKINYRHNPLHIAERHINHFGYSVGLFAGLGNTFMSPTNTLNAIDQEYDGIILSKGIAGIIGINNFTIGLSLGIDNLLDKNKKDWIYENKPWVGLAFGLNLN